MRNARVFALCALFFCSCMASAAPTLAQTASAPIIGPAVVQNGMRFETWLATPKIVIPPKSVTYGRKIAAVLLSVRVTNLTATSVHFDPLRLYPTKVIKPNGKELFPDPIMVAGYLRPAQEADYLLLQPGQSVILPYVTLLYWQQNHFCFTWGFRSFDSHPNVYEKMFVGVYQFRLHYSNSSSAVEIRREVFGKPIKTLTGFWVGDVTLPPLTFQLVKPSN